VSPSDAFSGQAQVPTGTSNVVVAATDASGNTRTNTYQVTASGGTTTYAYDLNGNLKNKTSGGVTTNYDWDAEDRLLDVKQGTTTLASFAYDGSGRRTQKVAGGVTHTYVYDGANIIEERLSSGQTYDYVQGPGIDLPFAMRDQTSVVSYYLVDHLGSTVQATNSAGTVTLSRDYDPFGNPIAGASNAGFAFTGREWDPETNLYYYRARFYDPKSGRFISEDPFRMRGRVRSGDDLGQLQLYGYVGNRPVNMVDPDGTVGPAAAAAIVLAAWAYVETLICFWEWSRCWKDARYVCSWQPYETRKDCEWVRLYWCGDEFGDCFIMPMACHVTIHTLL
jgi:RHS repeat-associated protein